MKNLPMLAPLALDQVDAAGNMLAGIHRTAAGLFRESWPGDRVNAWGVSQGGILRGVFAVINRDDYVACYAAIESLLPDGTLVADVDGLLQEALAHRDARPLYFNLRGDMTCLIAHLRKRGFKEDTCGNEMVCRQLDASYPDKGLVMRRYESQHFSAYLRLLDGAFNPLAGREGQQPGAFQRDRVRLEKQFSELSEKGDFAAFWQAGHLIGLYYLSGDVIDILAVHPDFQGKGYGRAILQHATRTLLCDRGVPAAWLYVTARNLGAKQMYLKSGYLISGFYSENTYRGDNRFPVLHLLSKPTI